MRAKKPVRLPGVLTRLEVRNLLRAVSGTPKLVALLLYGAGLRLLQKQQVRQTHRQDLGQGLGSVHLPNALARKYPGADRQWGWQYLFPAAVVSVDPRSGIRRRHPLDESLRSSPLFQGGT